MTVTTTYTEIEWSLFDTISSRYIDFEVEEVEVEVNSFELSLEKLCWVAREISPRKIERINRPTRHVLPQNRTAYWKYIYFHFT